MNQIFEIFPISEKTCFRDPILKIKNLELLAKILDIAFIALSSYKNGKSYQVFDAHVGDTLCQIRAYRLVQIIYSNDFSLKKQESELKNLQDLIVRLSVLINKELLTKNKRRTKEALHKDARLKFSDYLITYNITIKLSDNSVFLIQCYILTLFKSVDGNSLNYSNMMLRFKINKNQVYKLVSFFQKKLKVDSCQFIKKICVKNKNKNGLYYIIDAFLKSAKFFSNVVPNFLSLKIILQHMKSQALPILFIANRTTKNKKQSDQVYFISKKNSVTSIKKKNCAF